MVRNVQRDEPARRSSHKMFSNWGFSAEISEWRHQGSRFCLGTSEFHPLFLLLSPRCQLALREEPPGQQGDQDALQDSEEERGLPLLLLQQPWPQLEDQAFGDIKVTLPPLGCRTREPRPLRAVTAAHYLHESLNFSICLAASTRRLLT